MEFHIRQPSAYCQQLTVSCLLLLLYCLLHFHFWACVNRQKLWKAAVARYCSSNRRGSGILSKGEGGRKRREGCGDKNKRSMYAEICYKQVCTGELNKTYMYVCFRIPHTEANCLLSTAVAYSLLRSHLCPGVKKNLWK